MTPDELPAEIDRIAERLHGIRGTGAIFGMEVWGPIPAVGLTPTEAATAAYGDTTRVLSVGKARHRAWPREVRDHARTLAGVRPEFGTSDARREAEFLIDWALLLIEETLGPVRSAAQVEHAPRGWYAAVWNDWLLLTDEWAAVVSLTGDS